MDNKEKRIRMTLGNNLRRIRKERCKTQKQMAEAIGISTSYYANIETGRKMPSSYILFQIADCLNVTAQSLLTESTPDVLVSGIEASLRNQPLSVLSKIEKILRLILEN